MSIAEKQAHGRYSFIQPPAERVVSRRMIARGSAPPSLNAQAVPEEIDDDAPEVEDDERELAAAADAREVPETREAAVPLPCERTTVRIHRAQLLLLEAPELPEDVFVTTRATRKLERDELRDLGVIERGEIDTDMATTGQLPSLAWARGGQPSSVEIDTAQLSQVAMTWAPEAMAVLTAVAGPAPTPTPVDLAPAEPDVEPAVVAVAPEQLVEVTLAPELPAPAALATIAIPAGTPSHGFLVGLMLGLFAVASVFVWLAVLVS